MNFYKYWFEINFTVLKEINNLPLYTGIHWSAFLRDELKKYSSLFYDLQINVVPIDIAKNHFSPGEKTKIYIATNQKGKEIIQNWLTKSRSEKNKKSNYHFVLNKTIILDNWQLFKFEPENDFKYNNKSLTIIFPTPLRLKRKKDEYGRYFDPFHFDFEEFIQKLAESLGIDMPLLGNVKIINKSFIWIDVKYKKTIGGIIGGFTVEGDLSNDLINILHFGQFYGVGKNRTFGFGFYYIKENPSPIFAKGDIRNNIFSFENLKSNLKEMLEEGKEGSDFNPVELLEYPGYLQKVSKLIGLKKYQPQKPAYYKIKKKDGGFRRLASYSMIDKLILKILTDELEIFAENILSPNSYAYRKSYSYHQAANVLKKEFDKGFDWGIKLDIKSFFDTLSFKKINLIIDALWKNDIYKYLLSKYFDKYLIQGNTLSPMLSNLALSSFDNFLLKNKNIKLIRYADDMIILGRDIEKDKVMNLVENLLTQLDLTINYKKMIEFYEVDEIEFLGYKISQSFIMIQSETKEKNNLNWLDYPELSKYYKKPLYLSFSIQYAHTTGNNIYIEANAKKEKIQWKQISRIIVLGKPRISGGIIYRAIKEQIPLYFLSLHGRAIGGFLVHKPIKEPQFYFNATDDYSFTAYSLDFVREIAYSKVINQYRLLKKYGFTELRLIQLANEIKECEKIDSIRGKEGLAAKIYFAVFRELVKPFPFKNRSYHPPEGEVNVLLSLGYTLIYRRFAESLRFNGLDSFSGIFHKSRGTHEALASDFTEIFRYLIDRIVLALIHTKRIKLENFYTIQNSNYLKMDSEGFRAFIRYFEKTMKTEIKIKDRRYSYEIWIDKTVRSFKNSLIFGVPFKAYRSL